MFRNIFNIDRYALTVTYAFYKQNKHKQISTCDMFYRKPPSEFPFIVNAGIWWALEYIKSIKFGSEDLDYIENHLKIKDEGFKEYLSTFSYDRLHIDYLIEGEFVYPNTPILTITSELGYLLLFEAPLLSIFNLCTAIATNSLFYRFLSKDIPIIEMGLRRAYGPEAAYLCSLYAVCSGLDGSSNVSMNKDFGIEAKGTMSHAFILAFDNSDDFSNLVIPEDILQNLNFTKEEFLKDLHDRRLKFGFEKTSNAELKAFLSFMFCFKDGFSALIDTFNTLESGLKNFALVASYVSDMKIKYKGVRLDSGNLLKLSVEARKYLGSFDKAFGYNLAGETKILASSDIDAQFLKDMKTLPNEIDIVGIGTKLVTFKNIESVGMVYKLVDIDDSPRMKFSSDVGKANVPGRKKIYKIFSNGKRYHLVTRHDEQIHKGELIAYRLCSEKGEYILENIIIDDYELIVSDKPLPSKFDALACKERIDKNYKELIDSGNHIEHVLYSETLQGIVVKSHDLIKGFAVKKTE